MAWWMLPAIGAGIGALTNLNNPKQMFKNMGIGGLLGLGTSAIPGATAGVGDLLGLGATATTPTTTATGVAANMTPQLSSPAINSFLTKTPEMFAAEAAKKSSMMNPMFNNFMMNQGVNMLSPQGQPQQPQHPMLLGGGGMPSQPMARAPLNIYRNPQLQNMLYPNRFRLNMGRA